MLAVDTNVVVRFLLKDDLDQAFAARRLIASNTVLVATTVLLETEWVLRSGYRLSKMEIVDRLRAFTGLETVKLQDPAAIRRALDAAEAGLDFADALHLAQATACDAFVTFDKALIRKAAELDPDAVIREP